MHHYNGLLNSLLAHVTVLKAIVFASKFIDLPKLCHIASEDDDENVRD
jgi:hypothetical protein